MTNVQIEPSATLAGEIVIPGDKSISHRALMLASLAKGKSVIRGLLRSQDVLATLACFQEMGVPIEIFSDRLEIEGVGLYGLKAPHKVLDCGNSGTTLRLMMGLLAAQPFESRLTGDASLNKRPIERVAVPLRAMGAHIEELRASDTERVVKIIGRPLRGVTYKLPVASAQIKSAILLAALYAKGRTEVIEPVPSRDHTEIMLQSCGVPLDIKHLKISLEGGLSQLTPLTMDVPGDISSAAFFLVGGLISKNSHITLKNVGINPTRTGILEVLQVMGGPIQITKTRKVAGEFIADLVVTSSSLKGTKICGGVIPRLIDEIPILMVAAAVANGETKLRDASELRVKESDRIDAIKRELQHLGVKVRDFSDGLDLEGPNLFLGGRFQSGGDHRMAMSMVIAATQAKKSSVIVDVDCVHTSYPTFFEHLTQLGGKIEFI